MITRPELRAAAMLAVLGLPAHEYLTTTDPLLRTVLIVVARLAVELHARDHAQLAASIVNTYGKALRGR